MPVSNLRSWPAACTLLLACSSNGQVPSTDLCDESYVVGADADRCATVLEATPHFVRCPEMAEFVVVPLQTSVDGTIDISATFELPDEREIFLVWSAEQGQFERRTSNHASYVCTEAGDVLLELWVFDAAGCFDQRDFPVTCVGD
jgi:hypothetical protein